MFNLYITISVLTFGVNHASSTSNCHELHKSQLISLNERMTQMIDTISSLLPKPINKTKLPLASTPASPVDFVPSSPSYETAYSPPISTYPAQPPQMIYIAPPRVMVPSPMQGRQTTSSPGPYINTQAGLKPDYGPPILAPRLSRSNYQYENYPQYPNVIPMAIPYPSPPSHPTISNSPVNTDYSRTSFPGYPSALPALPTNPSYMPGQYYLPVPVYPTYPEKQSPKYV